MELVYGRKIIHIIEFSKSKVAHWSEWLKHWIADNKNTGCIKNYSYKTSFFILPRSIFCVHTFWMIPHIILPIAGDGASLFNFLLFYNILLERANTSFAFNKWYNVEKKTWNSE